MLNNKYLAIVLSIVAVAIIAYQVFIRKPDKPARPEQNQPMFSAQGRPRTTPQPRSEPQPRHQPQPQQPAGQPAPGMMTAPAGDNDGLVIDFDSELLLNRIDPQMMSPYPKQELSNQFGTPIFTGAASDEPVETEKPKYTKELKFELNAIIMDANRKLAIINDQILKVGQKVQGATITSIEKSKVILMIEQKQIVLSTNSRIQSIRLLEHTKQPAGNKSPQNTRRERTGGKQGEQ